MKFSLIFLKFENSVIRMLPPRTLYVDPLSSPLVDLDPQKIPTGANEILILYQSGRF